MVELTSSFENISQQVTPSLVYGAMKDSFQELYGDFGIAHLGTFGGI